MLRDMSGGGSDHVTGDLIRRADARGLDMQLLDIAWVNQQVYEQGRQG